jgi:hypothetical protein
MGNYTLAEYRDRLWMSMDRRPDLDPADPDNETMMDGWINDAYTHICDPKIYRHPAMRDVVLTPLVAGTRAYALPADIWAIRFVRLVDGSNALIRSIKPRTEQQILSTTAATGEPSSYARESDDIFIDTVPAAADVGKVLLIYHWITPALLAVDGATTTISGRFDPGLLKFAAGYGWADQNQFERSDQCFALGAALVNDVGDIESQEHIDEEDWQISIQTEGYQRTV